MNMLTKTKLIIGSTLCNPVISDVISIIFKGRIPRWGFVIDTNNDYIPRCNAASIFWGLYERKEIDLIRQFLRTDLDVIELGSSLGVISLHIIKVQNREQKIICLEANPYLIETIKANANLNAPWKNVEVLNRAIDYSGQSEVSFNVSQNNLGSQINHSNVDNSTSVKTTTLKKLIHDYHIKDFALVSDIEGAEAGMILKDVEALKHCKQMIIELHPINYEGYTYSVDELREKIEAIHGFRLIAKRHGVHVFENNYRL
jgi:FkbM family methyltransferase